MKKKCFNINIKQLTIYIYINKNILYYYININNKITNNKLMTLILICMYNLQETIQKI